MKDRSEKLGTERIDRLLLRFSLPAILGMTISALSSVVDRIFIGHAVGSEGIAAISVCFPIMMIMMAFGMLIGFGGSSLLAIRLGQGHLQEAEQILGNALVLYLLLSVGFTGLGLAFQTPLLRAFGASEAILPLARDYLTVILWGVLVHELTFGMNMFIHAGGNPKRAMQTLMIGAGLNLLLDPLFIFYLEGGVAGAAIATVLSQSVSALWVLGYFFKGKSTLRLRWKNLRPQAALVGRIAVIGSPPWAMALAGSGVQALLNNRLQLHGGDLAISVMGIIYGVTTMIRMPIAGLSQGAQPIIGYNRGALNHLRVRRTLQITLAAATAFTLIWFFAVEIWPGQILRLFGGAPGLNEMGGAALRTVLCMLPLAGVQMVSANYFQAVGKPRVALLLALSRQVLLLIPLVLILPSFFGLRGLWVALPTADFLAAVLSLFYLKRELCELGNDKCPPGIRTTSNLLLAVPVAEPTNRCH